MREQQMNNMAMSPGTKEIVNIVQNGAPFKKAAATTRLTSSAPPAGAGADRADGMYSIQQVPRSATVPNVPTSDPQLQFDLDDVLESPTHDRVETLKNEEQDAEAQDPDVRDYYALRRIRGQAGSEAAVRERAAVDETAHQMWTWTHSRFRFVSRERTV